MEGFLAAFVLGSLWFWIISVVCIVLMLWSIESESPGFSGFIFLVYLIFLQFLARADFFQQIIHHPGKTFLVISGYLLLGILWSLVKWWLYLHKEVESLQDQKEEFILRLVIQYNEKVKRTWTTTSNQTQLLDELKIHPNMDYYPEEIKKEWKEKVQRAIPKAKESKSTISIWILYWPLSAVWSLVNDFIKRFLRAIVTHLQGIYQGIAKSVYKNV